ncbi:hypothetical protein T10_10320 [Trichinella papuae]|uniref:F-box domain-containing protein n=1 Tax=Trichinella papuae TaxID=268474 RepID=A0A0V1N6F5_9BILA|nr:hypothetical protein T10_10320 [Trichinella papuae]
MLINDLPDDILMEIFSLLDFTSYLLQSALVYRLRIKSLDEAKIVDRNVWLWYMSRVGTGIESPTGTVSKLTSIFQHIGHCNTLKIQASSKVFLKEVLQMLLIQCKFGTGKLVLVAYDDFAKEIVEFLSSRLITLHLHHNLMIYTFRGIYLKKLSRLINFGQPDENPLPEGYDHHSRNLELFHQHMSAFQVLQLFFNLPSNLESLEMWHVRAPPVPVLVRPPPPPLKSLAVHQCNGGASTVGLLLGHFCNTRLKTKYITVHWMYDGVDNILQLIFKLNAKLHLCMVFSGMEAIEYHPWLFDNLFSMGTFEHLESIYLNDQPDVDGLLNMIVENCPKLNDLIRSVTAAGILAFLNN